jgi:NAD(P)-dependent dehydrogenase (short-subunit alcohol dehydrogenase family)
MLGGSEDSKRHDNAVLLTGGSSGIGMATANLLQQNGYQTISISRTGVCVAGSLGIECDVGDADQIAALPDKLRQRGVTSLVGLFLAAGGGGFSKLSSVACGEIDSAYEVDFRGSLLCVRELTPFLARGGAIVFCSSAVAGLARAEVSYYGALKAAIEALTLSLAAELG